MPFKRSPACVPRLPGDDNEAAGLGRKQAPRGSWEAEAAARGGQGREAGRGQGKAQGQASHRPRARRGRWADSPPVSSVLVGRSGAAGHS